jgi:hypothetical protein
MKWRKEEFGDRRSHVAGEAPINVKMTATGWLSNGISWDDFSRMQTRLKKTTGERRLPTPLWAMNNAMLRRVLVRFMEERAFSKKERATLKGGLRERLAQAAARVASKRPSAIATLYKLCEEHVAIRQRGLNPKMTDKEWNESKPQPYMPFAEGEARYVDEQKRIKQLESEIEGIDTYLRISENGGADVVAAAVYLYYRTGLDSVGVGSELGLKPPHVRQTLFRLHQTAKRLEEEGAFKTIVKKQKKDKKDKSYRLITPPLF